MVVINEKHLKDNFAVNLRYLRLRNTPRISQAMLARIIGSSQRSISNYEKAYHLPPTHVLAALAKYFGLTMDELMMERVPESPSVPQIYTKEEGTTNE